MFNLRLFLPLLASATSVAAFDYALTSAGDISLEDLETSITDLKTVFTGKAMGITVSGIEWESLPEEDTTDDFVLLWETSVQGVVQQNGTVELSNDRELLTSLECGSMTVDETGSVEITVTLTVDKSSESTSSEYASYAPGVSIIPLVVILIVAMTTQMVELSFFLGIFVGACMISGNIKDGFFATLDNYILNAIANGDHVYVVLFTLFLSGLVGMIQKSGGMIGFTNTVGKFATSSRAGQLVTFLIGCCIFFDDYANILLAGVTMRPLTDLLFISREKLAFLVDATAAPIASISPISSWVGFEVGLINSEIKRISDIVGEENLTIDTSGTAIFLKTIQYRYYPIFMLILIPLLILTQRDFGPMLIAERRVRVYNKTDGGDGADNQGEGMNGGKNEPRVDTPKKVWNMIIPIGLLVFFIIYFIIMTGADSVGDDASFMDKIENSDSYSALLWGTMTSALLSVILYLIQLVQFGKLTIPTFSVMKSCLSRGGKSEETTALKESADVEAPVEAPVMSKFTKARSLLSIFESTEAFLFGMGRVFPALIILTLAWASGSLMVAVGADRLFSSWITSGISAEILPTFSFLISFLMALATGTSWGTMGILFPLISYPTYQVSDGDALIFYATVAGVLSGSVAGDHVSPISDTTVLSSLAANCKLFAHVNTQAPYAFFVSIFSVLLGTLPVGAGAPGFVGIILGTVAVSLFVWFVCVPVISESGRFDIITRLFLGRSSSLRQLQEDTIKKSKGDTSLKGVASADNTLEPSVVKDVSSTNNSDDEIKEERFPVESSGAFSEEMDC